MLKFIITTVLLCFSLACDAGHVVVSIAPYKYFVNKIAGTEMQVDILVPAGSSPHFYEPTAQQILRVSEADIWFTMGESFEARARTSMQYQRPNMSIVDLREGVEVIRDHACCCCQHEANSIDPHIWLSPREAKKQAASIAEALIKRYPQNKEIYQKNLENFQRELNDLDMEIATILKPLINRTILVSHPAMGYFCRDYGLEQLSIEFEGKEPSAKQMSNLLTLARDKNIKTVYIQEQHLSKGAHIVAKHIGAKVVDIDPLAESYIENMRQIAIIVSSQ